MLAYRYKKLKLWLDLLGQKAIVLQFLHQIEKLKLMELIILYYVFFKRVKVRKKFIK